MRHSSNLASSFRSGLAWLRSQWQRNGCTRHVVIGLLAHVILYRPLVAGFLLCGVPEPCAELVALICVLCVGYFVAKGAESKSGE